jgi:putative ABC transport system permease protein
MKKPVSPPRLAVRLLDRFSGREDDYGAAGDIEEYYRALAEDRGIPYARRAYWKQVRAAFPGYVKNIFIWSEAMLKHYFRIAVRNLGKHKGYSFLNIAGLSVGLAAALFILLFVRFELGFDRFHKDLERIYLVGLSTTTETGKSLSGGNMPLMGPTIQSQYPQVEAFARIYDTGTAQVGIGREAFREERLIYTDNAIFEILNLSFLQGDPSRALDRPQTAVLSRTMALKCFGAASPVGRVLKIDDKDFEITGVVADARPDSDFRFNILRS